MNRSLLLVLFACAFSGCAAVNTFIGDVPPESRYEIADVPKMTPMQSYEAGVTYLQRGEYELARHEWDRCLAMAAPDSPARLDCLVARERLAYPAAMEQ